MKKLLLTPLAALLVASAWMTTSCNKDDDGGTTTPVDTADKTVYTAATVARTTNNTDYAEPATLEISGSITRNTVLKTGKTYTLRGFVFVRNGATLRIEAGTKIVGDKATLGSLIITRNGKIDAQGTAAAPIVFTSAQSSPVRGDWGGIILLGNAPTNGVYSGTSGLQEIEGGVNSATTGFGLHGGTDANDNSGTMKYVRIEFPGVAFQPNSEINGLTFGSVGAGTTIDFIEVYNSGDDAFEWFGGTVNAKHLIAVGSTDDDFDTDNGFSGKIQYGISLRDYQQVDFATGGTSNGFESDNNADGTAATPRTSAVFANMTLVGPKPNLPTGGTLLSQWGRGAHIRRNSSISLFNTAFIGWPTGIRFDGQLTNNNFRDGNAEIKNVAVVDANTNRAADTAGGIATNPIAPLTFFATAGWNNITPSGSLLTSLIYGSTFNPIPVAGSAFLNAPAITSGKTSGLETANYYGAVTTGATWHTGWTRW